MNSVTVKFKRMSATAKLPTKGTPDSACVDLHADEDCVVEPRRSRVIPTGLATEFPPGYTLEVFSRSGHGAKLNVRLANGTGIIDPDYRGELMVALFNDSRVPFPVSRGDRIAQAMVVVSPRMEIQEVEDLGETARGSGGFGHTGV